jgi:hypothetical protein
LQAFRDSLHLRLHDLAEADKLYWSHADEAAGTATGHGLVEEDGGLTALALLIEPSHHVLKLVDALFEEVLLTSLLGPPLKLRRGHEAGEQVLGLRNGGPNLRTHLVLAVDQDTRPDAAELRQLARLLDQTLASLVEHRTTTGVLRDPLEIELLATHGTVLQVFLLEKRMADGCPGLGEVWHFYSEEEAGGLSRSWRACPKSTGNSYFKVRLDLTV